MVQSSSNRYIAIGLMLFALFFGAGNLIFPASMGQAAGENVWWAVLGFCVTGVGMPLLSIMAMGYSGCNDLEEAAGRVHPLYGLLFTIVVYMSIGPCFAAPRTGTVAYEIAVRPFLGSDATGGAMTVFLIVFFAVAFWLAATPSKLVDRIGKILTPALVATIAILVVKSVMTPLGEIQAAGTAYTTPLVATVQGVIDGYNTLDAIAGFVFAILVVSFIKDTGIVEPKQVMMQVYKSGFVAVVLLGIIYVFIAKIGAESVQAIGMKDTGAPILTESARLLLGNFGAVVLAVIVLLACLTTAIGLISCCATYFRKLVGRGSYVAWCAAFSIMSLLVGMFGLKTIIVSTIPVLMFIYPLSVVLIVLLFLDKFYDGRQCVYVWTVAFTFVMATINGMETAGVNLGTFAQMLKDYVPLHTLGMGWIGFAFVGFVVGMIWKSVFPAKAA
ncbi:MAG: branched-chain amino acid transport system II carrier protein [Duodenibacillus sp.]|nr:branched-chain amino acid transport system II carrier protein [Duodenibacillus sp.]